MYIQQLYTDSISEAAYFIESDGEAAIIDPQRDIEEYLRLAQERNAKIKYIFETHFHTDFVSGHLDLQKATGATIVYGPGAKTNFKVHVAADGEQFKLGALTISAMHTPGHTPESTCWLLNDAEGMPYALFTGDTLLVGEVGQPDHSSSELSSEELAGMLYDSLYIKIASLPDSVLVYPAHGPGSAFGKSLGTERNSTIGQEKATNYALKSENKEAFIELFTKGVSSNPQYFPINAAINQKGYQPIQEVLSNGLRPLNPEAFTTSMMQSNVLVIDSRPATTFTKGFIPNSVSIGLEGRFTEWAGSLLPYDKQLLIVADPGKEEETIRRLARVGFEHFLGHLAGGFESWRASGKPIDMVIDVEADELAMDLPFDDNLLVVDVRNEPEFGSGHIVGAMHLPLSEMNDTMRIATLPEEANIYLHCSNGYRSVTAASLIKRQGIHNVRNVLGGWDAIKEQEKIPVEKQKEVLN